nr:hypothetical protein [Tanacetum cinerariifolium]
ELWTFVGKKENKQWLWLALNPANRQIIAFHIGSRSGKDAQLFYEKIPAVFKGIAGFFSDYWQAYKQVVGVPKYTVPLQFLNAASLLIKYSGGRRTGASPFHRERETDK